MPVVVFINNNTLPTAQISTPTITQSGACNLLFTVDDPDSDPVDVLFEYQYDGETTWRPATSSNPGGLTGLASGTPYTFTWQTDQDVRSGYVRVRVTPSDQYGRGTPAATGLFVVANLGEDGGWVPKQVQPEFYSLDSVGTLRAFAELLEWVRLDASRMLRQDLVNATDPKTAKPKLLSDLASRAGLRLPAAFTETSKRRQIQDAVSWYKLKGLGDAFSLRFESMGYECTAIELWSDGTQCFDTPIGIEPIARIDLEILKFDPSAPYQPTDFDNLSRYIEEVRPAHVLIRELITGFSIADDFEPPTDSDDEPDILVPLFDRFDIEWITSAPPTTPQLFEGYRPPLLLNGAWWNVSGDQVDPVTGQPFTLGSLPDGAGASIVPGTDPAGQPGFVAEPQPKTLSVLAFNGWTLAPPGSPTHFTNADTLVVEEYSDDALTTLLNTYTL